MLQNPSTDFFTGDEHFSIVNTDLAECKADFLIEKEDIPLLVANGTICDRTEGLFNCALC